MPKLFFYLLQCLFIFPFFLSFFFFPFSFFFFFNTKASPIPTGCPDGEIACPDTGKCIAPSFICDDYDDCGNAWDEQNCSK